MLTRSNHSAICRRFSGGKFNKKTSRTRSRSKTRLRSRSSFCGNQRAVSSDRWSWSDTYKSYFDFEFSSNFGAFMPNFSASLRPPRAILLHPLFDPLNQSSSQHARPWLPSPRTCLPRFTWIRSLSFAFAARAVKVFQEIPAHVNSEHGTRKWERRRILHFKLHFILQKILVHCSIFVWLARELSTPG